MPRNISSYFHENSKESAVFNMFKDSGVEFLDNIVEFATDIEFIESPSEAESLEERRKMLAQLSGLFENSKYETEADSQYVLKAPEPSAEVLANKIFSSIRNNPFEEGQLSSADLELEKILNQRGRDLLVEVFSILWRLCFKSHHSDFAHFLNCVQNISYYVDSEEFLVYACTAISHRNLAIREAGIALFEHWGVAENVYYLENIAESGVSWLDSYKNEVIETLRR